MFLYSSSVYSCHLFLISSISVGSIPFLFFIVPIFEWYVPLVSLIFLKRSLAFPILLSSSHFFALITEEGFLNLYVYPVFILKKLTHKMDTILAWWYPTLWRLIGHLILYRTSTKPLIHSKISLTFGPVQNILEHIWECQMILERTKYQRPLGMHQCIMDSLGKVKCILTSWSRTTIENCGDPVHQIACAVPCLVTQSCLTLFDPIDCSLPGSSVHGDSPGKNIGVGCHALLQGIFATQGSNPAGVQPLLDPGIPSGGQRWRKGYHSREIRGLTWLVYMGN